MSLADKYKKKKPKNTALKRALWLAIFALIVLLGMALRDEGAIDGLIDAWENVWEDSFMGR